jgi:hypothetical protein
LDEGIGGEEVAKSRVGEEGALTLEAEDHVLLCGGGCGWVVFFGYRTRKIQSYIQKNQHPLFVYVCFM